MCKDKEQQLLDGKLACVEIMHGGSSSSTMTGLNGALREDMFPIVACVCSFKYDLFFFVFFLAVAGW